MARQYRFKAVLGFAILGALLGWGGTARAAEMEKIKLALHWNAPIAEFIQYYAAIKLGFFKAQNLDVELLPLPGSVPSVTSVSNGDAPIGQASADAILVGLSKNAPLKVVFLLFQQSPTGVIVYKDSGIKTFADLRGKTISTSVASPEGITLNARLHEIGLDPQKDVHILNVAPGAKLTMMLTGQAETSTGFLDFQYIQAQLQSKKPVEFLPFSTKKAPLYGHAVFVNTKWLEKHQDTTRRFVAATVQGLVWARSHVDEAADLVVNWDPSVKINRDFIKRCWEAEVSDLLSNDVTAKRGLGHMETAGWANLAKILKDGSVIQGNIDAAKMYTNAYIPKDAPKW